MSLMFSSSSAIGCSKSRNVVFIEPYCSGSPLCAYAAVPLLAVLRRQVADYVLHVRLGHGCTHHLDHFVYRGFPSLAVEEGRIHLDVVEAVAHRAVGLDQLLARAILQMKVGFSGKCGECPEQR